jgi:acyl-CoA synthetase (AMP-forming)/AMP-acid ligase II
MNLSVRFGAALSLVPRFTPEKVLAAIERDRATIFDGVPTMFSALLAYAGQSRYDVDADGFFFIVDRKKELIIRGGYNVYPPEVEEVLYRHPDVLEAAVVGVPDERLGQEVKAFIVPRPGHSLTTERVVEYCRDRLAAYKYPRLVELRETLPLTAAGKVVKKELV